MRVLRNVLLIAYVLATMGCLAWGVGCNAYFRVLLRSKKIRLWKLGDNPIVYGPSLYFRHRNEVGGTPALDRLAHSADVAFILGVLGLLAMPFLVLDP